MNKYFSFSLSLSLFASTISVFTFKFSAKNVTWKLRNDAKREAELRTEEHSVQFERYKGLCERPEVLWVSYCVWPKIANMLKCARLEVDRKSMASACLAKTRTVQA
jgi:hypothetical protein